MLQNFKESTSIDNKSNFSNLFLRDHFHNLNKKKKKLLLLLSSKHLGILLESAVSPGWGPSTSLCLHICVIRLPFQQTCFIFQQFFFSSSFFIYKLRPLSLWPYYRDRYNTLKEKRSRLVERYRGSPVLIEAAVSSFGQISISISIICSILIRDWKRRGSMEFFQLQFAQLVETWIIFQSLDFRILLLLFDLVIFLRKWKGCSFSNCLISRKSSITIDSTIIVQISFVYLARCAISLEFSLFFFSKIISFILSNTPWRIVSLFFLEILTFFVSTR